MKISKKSFKTGDPDGFKEAWDNISMGNELYKLGSGALSEAKDYYVAALDYNSEYAELNYLTGVCFLFSDEKQQALEYIKKSYEGNPGLHEDILFYLARAYHYSMKFEEAESWYKKYREQSLSQGNVDKAVMIDKYLIECQSGIEMVKNPQRVILTNLGHDINSEEDDYFPVLSANDSIMYFTSRRFHEKRKKKNPYDNKYFEDVYTSALLNNAHWGKASPVAGNINDDKNNACVGIYPDDKRLFIYNGNTNGGDVFSSEYNQDKDEWGRIKPVSSRLRSPQAEGAVFYTVTGDTLYMISADEDLSEGGKDIMISTRDEKGKWMKPRNLGSLINSPYDEEGIYVSPDGKELYFSSRGHNSMGGYDIFHSHRQEDGSWSAPLNMGYPINSPEDEIFYTQTRNGTCGYYSTIREGTKGGKDLYKITYLGVEKELLLSTDDDLIITLPDTTKTGFFKTPEKTESIYTVRGRITDRETGKPLVGKLEFNEVNSSKIIATAISSETGSYSVKLTKPQKYEVEVLSKGYLFQLNIVNLSDASTDKDFIKDFQLDEIKVGIKLVLENIYFQTGKSKLKPESYPQLDQVVILLKNNSGIRLEISGHTDNTGSITMNNLLSKNRAKAVVDYIVSQGISVDRLEYQGYSFTQPISANSSPEGRAKNRRVEMKILSK